MKKIFLLAFFLFLIPFALSLEVNSKDSYMQGETALIVVSGNFISPILEKNIAFYRGAAKSGVELSLDKIEDEYYISVSLLDKKPGNYSIKITGASHLEGRALITDDIIIPFQINEETADFSIFPGSIITEENFSIKLQNLKSSKIYLTISGEDSSYFVSESSYYEIKSGEIKNINIQTTLDETPKLTYLYFSIENYTYTLPVYIASPDYSSNGTKKEYTFDPSVLTINISTDSEKTYSVYLENTGDVDLENISLNVSKEIKDYVNLSLDQVSSLEKNSSIKIELYVSPISNEISSEGRIIAVADGEIYSYLKIYLETTSSYIPITNTTEPENNQTLIDDTPVQNTSSTTKLVGWIIVAVLLAILAWFFLKKYKRAGNSPIDLFKIAKGKKREFEEKEILLDNKFKI
jgi:hypothetical protein